MKKLALFIAMTALAAGSAMAQDTIPEAQMENYFYHYGPYPEGKNYRTSSGTLGTEPGGEMGIYQSTSDTLTVYGIAAVLKDRVESNFSNVAETTYANAIEWLRLYRPHPDSLETIRQTPVHMNTTPISYYMDFNTSSYPHQDQLVMPFYERYFDSAATVIDSFYIGMTFCGIYADPADTNYRLFRHPPISLGLLGEIGYGNNVQSWTRFRNSHMPYDASGDHWYWRSWPSNYYLIFPILTPNPDTNFTPDTTVVSDTTYIGDTLVVTDTVIIGGDTIITTDTILTIQNGTLLDRLTGVMPNPAVGTAKVVSSFGMSMVEAYDMSGTLVHRQKADGLATTLDVRRWPTGTYLLRIHTPQGTATKKLVVRR